MNSMKLLTAAFVTYILVGMIYFAPSCTSTGEPNWDTVETELVLAEGTLDRARISFPTKAEMIDDLEAARAEALKAVQLIRIGDPKSALDYLDAALVLVQPYLEDEDLRFAAFALSESIARVRAYSQP